MSDPKPKRISWMAVVLLVALVIGDILILLLSPAEYRAEAAAAYSTFVALLLARTPQIIALLPILYLAGCGAGSVATVYTVANATREATCLVCRKLQDIGVCDAGAPESGTDSP